MTPLGAFVHRSRSRARRASPWVLLLPCPLGKRSANPRSTSPTPSVRTSRCVGRAATMKRTRAAGFSLPGRRSHLASKLTPPTDIPTTPQDSHHHIGRPCLARYSYVAALAPAGREGGAPANPERLTKPRRRAQRADPARCALPCRSPGRRGRRLRPAPAASSTIRRPRPGAAARQEDPRRVRRLAPPAGPQAPRARSLRTGSAVDLRPVSSPTGGFPLRGEPSIAY